MLCRDPHHHVVPELASLKSFHADQVKPVFWTLFLLGDFEGGLFRLYSSSGKLEHLLQVVRDQIFEALQMFWVSICAVVPLGAQMVAPLLHSE